MKHKKKKKLWKFVLSSKGQCEAYSLLCTSHWHSNSCNTQVSYDVLDSRVSDSLLQMVCIINLHNWYRMNYINLQREEQDWKGVIHTRIYTCILCKIWIINKRLHQLSYLDNFSFQLYKLYGLNVFCKYCYNIGMSQGALLALW
jgi:hypothetical protein